MGAFCLHRHPVSVNCLYQAPMVLSVGGSFAFFAQNARCTVTTDLLCDIPTHKKTFLLERPFSHYIYSHCLAAEMWPAMKTNLLGKSFLSCSFYLYRFRKYVSYRFPITKFCIHRSTLWNALYKVIKKVDSSCIFCTITCIMILLLL